MELNNKLQIVKHLCKNTVENFIQIGLKLKAIRDNNVFKEKYSTFTECISVELPNLSRGFVYRLFQLVEDPKLVTLARQLGLTKALELVRISERETREELAEKAVKENLTKEQIRNEVNSKKIKRLASNISENVIKGDNPEDKCLRQGETLLFQLNALNTSYNQDKGYLKIGYSKWKDFAFKYPDNLKIQKINEELKELK